MHRHPGSRTRPGHSPRRGHSSRSGLGPRSGRSRLYAARRTTHSARCGSSVTCRARRVARAMLHCHIAPCSGHLAGPRVNRRTNPATRLIQTPRFGRGPLLALRPHPPDAPAVGTDHSGHRRQDSTAPPSTASRDATDHQQHARRIRPMTHQNTHRALGRAVTPLTASRRAAHVFGGSAVLGTVLVGTAFAGGTAAMANDEALMGSDQPATTQSAPESPAGLRRDLLAVLLGDAAPGRFRRRRREAAGCAERAGRGSSRDGLLRLHDR